MKELRKTKVVHEGKDVTRPAYARLLKEAIPQTERNMAVFIHVLGYQADKAARVLGVQSIARKANPYHNADGTFASKDSAAGVQEDVEFDARRYATGSRAAFAADTKSHEVFKEAYGKWAESLTGDEKWAVDKYRGDSYMEINQFLRGKRADTTYRDQIDDLIEAIAKAGPTKSSFYAYRGVDKSVFDQLTAGAVFEDSGFVSTSVSPFQARRFGHEESSEGGTVRLGIRIKVPKGATGAYLSATDQGHAWENEFLLPPGTRFKVVEGPKEEDLDTFSRADKKKFRYITVELLSGKAEQRHTHKSEGGSGSRFSWSGDDLVFVGKKSAASVLKANPYHNADGTFGSKDGATFVSVGEKFKPTIERLKTLDPVDGIGVMAKHSSGASIDALSLAENKALMASLHKAYAKDPDFRGACDVVSKYREIRDTGLAVREIVAQALKGRTAEDLLADPKINALRAKAAYGMRTPPVTDDTVRQMVEGSKGYFRAIREAEPTTSTIYRGAASAGGKADEFELRGPTAFSHQLDAAMTYSNGVLFRVSAGAKVLPTGMLDNAKRGAETAPAFYKRSDNSVHPKGPGYGFAMDLDTDRELTTSGRFRVKGRSKKEVTYVDSLTGKRRTRTVTVVDLEQIGVF